MRPASLPRTARPFIPLVMLALVFGGCRSSQRTDVRTDPAIQTKSEPDSKVGTEKPSLAARIENVSMYPVPNHREDLAVSLVVSVGNAGSPTSVQDWNLEVNSPSRGGPTILQPVHISGYVAMPGTENTRVDLAKEDLVVKTAQVEIAKGARVKGFLTFVLAKTSEDELSNNGTGLIVHFKDSQGNPYQTPKNVIEEKIRRSK